MEPYPNHYQPETVMRFSTLETPGAAQARVGDVMKREFVTTQPWEMLQTALARLQDCNCHALPVVEGGRLVGLVTADNLAEWTG